MELIKKYFPELQDDPEIWKRIESLQEVYSYWNERINVISRKDMDHFYERHVLHSLAIAKFFNFSSKDQVLDIGTGGGFPGIPLAILFPETSFVLMDSRKKKCEVTQEAAKALKLQNVRVVLNRVEETKGRFSHIVSRAVAPMQTLYGWSKHLLKPDNSSVYIFLKGGDLNEEISEFQMHNPKWKVFQQNLSESFEEEFFSTKKVLWAKRK